MLFTFQEEGHKYISDPPRKWISATKVVDMFSPEFDEIEMANRCACKSGGKWEGLFPGEIIDIWHAETKRSTDIGSLFHGEMERKAIAAGHKMHRGKRLPVFPTLLQDGVKAALSQQLVPGCYLEHMMYDYETGLCGQTDLLLDDGEFIDVYDYKTNKKLDMHAYGWNYGSPEGMLSPISHLENCHYHHYNFQLSIYMYLALKANPTRKPGQLKIFHAQLKVQSRDKYDFPTIAMKDGLPIVERITSYEMPYLEREVLDVIDWIKRGIKN